MWVHDVVGLVDSALPAAKNVHLSAISDRLASAVAPLNEATQWIVQAYGAHPAAGAAGSVCYLTLMGISPGGWVLARGALAAATILAPRAPLVANVTAQPTNDPEAIRRMLVEQVTGRVRWRESVTWMAETGGVTRFAEAGAGKVLSGMAKRIAPDAEATPLNGPADLEAFAKSL